MSPFADTGFLQAVFDAMPNPILIHRAGKVIFANAQAAGITGLAQELLPGRDVQELLTDPADPENAVFRLGPDGEYPAEEEFAVRTANRKVVIRNFLVRNNPIRYKGKDAVLTVLIDITARKHLEKYIISRVIETEEKNRRQFAADLHDDLGPILSSIKLHLGLLQTAKSREKADDMLFIINHQLAEVIAKMRLVANNLSPRLIENFGLEAAVRSFISMMQNEESFRIELDCNLDGRRFNRPVEIHYYRILCELINNTVKHSGASVATVGLHCNSNSLTLSYTDNGKGYDADEIRQKPGGMGIGNILQRASLIDARITFGRENGQTTVSLVRDL